MGITLDGSVYDILQTNYGHHQEKHASTAVGITGLPLRVEGGSFANTYNLTLVCTTSEITTLRTSFAKVATTGTPPTNRLNYVDEEGVTWNPASSGGGNTGTGGYFVTMGEPKPLTPLGWSSKNRFSVQVVLQVYSANLNT